MDTAPSAHDLLASLSPLLPGAKRIYLAYSGGLDSTVLLHAAARIVPREKLVAVHVDHGFSPRSVSWREHCVDCCAALGVECVSREVRVQPAGNGLEQAAREARYRVFVELLGEGDLLLMAHHLDDQVETVLYRLLRGSGPAGLAGVPASRPLGRGTLARPLLETPRSELEDYAGRHGLRWVEDESNARLDHDRNYLRHRVLPAVEARWPDYRRRLARTATHCDSAARALEELALLDLEALDERREKPGHSIAIDPLSRLSRPRQENLLRIWPWRRNRDSPGHGVVHEVLDTLLPARRDGAPAVRWKNGEFRRFQNRLYLLPPLPVRDVGGEAVPVSLPGDGGTVPLAGGGVLRVVAGKGKGALAVKPGDRFAVGYRRGGEYCRPAIRAGGGTLKKLLNEYRLEPWLRDRIPLIYRNDELAAVAGLFVCREHCCGEGERGIAFEWAFPEE